MSIATMHFTPSLHVLNAASILGRRAICGVHVECTVFGGWERFQFRSLHRSSTMSYEQTGRFSSSSKDSRGPKSFSRVVEFESQLWNPVRQRCRKQIRSWCVIAKAGNPLQSAESLRDQLEALQQEAEQVRGRANSARMRFMRLTHVVEQLRQRAAMDVRSSKEDSARRLLIEKQKVMKAMEAARQRAELLEQLAGKLNVAISMKETQLIAVLSSAPLSMKSETSADTAVHHVSPRMDEGVEKETSQSVDKDDTSFRAAPNSDRSLNARVDVDQGLG